MSNEALDFEQIERDNVIPFERPKLQTGGKTPPSGPNWLLEIPKEAMILVKDIKNNTYILDIFIVYEAHRDYYRLFNEILGVYEYVDPNRFSNQFELIKILGYTKL